MSTTVTTNNLRRSNRIRNQNVTQSRTDDITDDDSNYKNKLRRRPSRDKCEQDMVNLEGDIHHDWNDGDIVWAKYQDCPWWPGQIEINDRNFRKRRQNKKSTICVKWFGDFGTQTNECKLIHVVPWDPDDRDRIFIEVTEEDIESFQDSMDRANVVYLELCEERGEKPLQTALEYDERNALVNNGYNGKKRRRRTKKTNNLTERQRSLRSNKNYVSTTSVTKIKSSRRSSRIQRKIALASQSDYSDHDSLTNRGRKRNFTQMNNSSNSIHQRRRRRLRNNSNTSKDILSYSEDDTDKNFMDDFDYKDDSEIYPIEQCKQRLKAAWEMVEETHSAEDFTPFIALFYFGIRTYNKDGNLDEHVIKTVAKIFHVEEDQVFHHLSEFVESNEK